jgi:hypothetical protein
VKAPQGWLAAELRRHGISRREFLGFCATMASALALPDKAAAQIAQAVLRTQKPILVWLEFQDCAGNTESFLRATRPSPADVVLDLLSLDYHETIMAAAGHQAEENLQRTVKEQASSKDRYQQVLTVRTARLAVAPRSRSPERCAGMPPRRLPLARALPLAAFLQHRPIRPVHSVWRMPSPECETSSISQPVPRMSRT